MIYCIFVDEFVITGSSAQTLSKESNSVNFTHTLSGPFCFFSKEEKDKFVSNLTLAFSKLYNTVEITEVNKP